MIQSFVSSLVRQLTSHFITLCESFEFQKMLYSALGDDTLLRLLLEQLSYPRPEARVDGKEPPTMGFRFEVELISRPDISTKCCNIDRYNQTVYHNCNFK